MKIKSVNEAMSKDTQEKMEYIFDKLGNRWVAYDDVWSVLKECGWNYTYGYNTFMKHSIMETKVEDQGKYMSLEEFVEYVNSLAGEDLYDADFQYEVRDGKVYERNDVRYYYMKGIK